VTLTSMMNMMPMPPTRRNPGIGANNTLKSTVLAPMSSAHRPSSPPIAPRHTAFECVNRKKKKVLFPVMGLIRGQRLWWVVPA